ncbi:pyruvate kinase [Candidatus Poribacteria bacterium]|nr:pyruvate kinase [Candidatus Poribacteria bacterium]
MTQRKRTKIVCTIGPASNTPETLRALIEAGMNVARLSFSHGSHADHAKTIRHIRTVSQQLDVRLPIIQDLSGPKMRIGSFADETIELSPNARFTLTTRSVIGDSTVVSMNYPELIADVQPGNRILLADGEIELQVISTTDSDIVCEVIFGGELRANKGISVPGVSLQTVIPTDKDITDLRFGIQHGIDWVAQSFVRSAVDLRNLRSLLRENNANVPIIAKLEKREALDDLDAILAETDGVMIARGDLGLEMPLPEIPLIQKEIITQANHAGKPVITATQMLESMITNPRPTRAEVTDIANAIFDGTDALMLSGETAIGEYPISAVKTMADVAVSAESRNHTTEHLRSEPVSIGENIPEAIAHAACHTALRIGAKAIICCTRSGQTARLVAKYRPNSIIGVVSADENTLRRTMLFWGTSAVSIPFMPDTDTLIECAKKAVLTACLARSGDRVVIIAGVPADVSGTTNMIKADVL